MKYYKDNENNKYQNYIMTNKLTAFHHIGDNLNFHLFVYKNGAFHNEKGFAFTSSIMYYKTCVLNGKTVLDYPFSQIVSTKYIRKYLKLLAFA